MSRLIVIKMSSFWRNPLLFILYFIFFSIQVLPMTFTYTHNLRPLPTICENGFCLNKRVNWWTGKNSKLSLGKAFSWGHLLAARRHGISYACWIPLRQWSQQNLCPTYKFNPRLYCGYSQNITKENLTKHWCKYSKLMTRYGLGHVLAR